VNKSTRNTIATNGYKVWFYLFKNCFLKSLGFEIDGGIHAKMKICELNNDEFATFVELEGVIRMSCIREEEGEG